MGEVKIFPDLIILVDVQRLHENCKSILCVSNEVERFFDEISGCGIDSCCNYLNFRYHACFEQGVPWHSDNYGVYIHSKTCMWHGKNTQLKNLLPLYSVLLIYLIYNKVKVS